MPYIGNQSTNSYSSMVKQDLTGASGSSVTLSHPVANANEVELYINNVRQEPTTSYTTNGTTLNFVGYTVAASDDIYVIFSGKALQTIVPPDGSVSTAKIASSAVDLTSKVTGVLPVANGGTGSTSYNATGLVRLGHQNISANTTEVLFDNIITSDYGQIFATGEVVSTSGTNCHMHIHYRSGGASGSDISSNMAHYQGDWANRAAGSGYQGNVLNGTNAYLKIATASTIYGGANIGFEASWRSLHSGVTAGTTNVSSREVRTGNFAWSFHATNASDSHGGNGWFRADSHPSTHTVTGLRFALSNGNMQGGMISVYGFRIT